MASALLEPSADCVPNNAYAVQLRQLYLVGCSVPVAPKWKLVKGLMPNVLSPNSHHHIYSRIL